MRLSREKVEIGKREEDYGLSTKERRCGMKYEKPRLVQLNATTAQGLDCTPGGTADTKCQAGGYTSGGDCKNNGTTATTECNDGITNTAGPCKIGGGAVGACTPTGTGVV